VNEPVRRSPLARRHRDLGAAVDREAGWELVAHYGDESEEGTTLKDAVGLVDVTPRGKIDARGALDGALSSAGDALTARISSEWALVLTEPGGEEVLVPKMESAAGPGAMVTDATHLFAGFALAGPALPEALERLTSWDPASLKPGSATGAPIADVRAVVVQGDLDVPVLEAYVATEFARYAWETVLDAVRRTGGGPVGWNALRARGWS
jgi:glycine cleavage system aminomethyltransferase T